MNNVSRILFYIFISFFYIYIIYHTNILSAKFTHKTDISY